MGQQTITSKNVHLSKPRVHRERQEGTAVQKWLSWPLHWCVRWARRSKQAVAGRVECCVFYLHSFQGKLMHKRGYGRGQDVILGHKAATHWTRVLNLLTSAELLQPVCAKDLFYSI